MSNRLFQGLVYQMRDTINRTIGVVDENATIIACSDLTKIGEPNDYLAIDLNENNDLFNRLVAKFDQFLEVDDKSVEPNKSLVTQIPRTENNAVDYNIFGAVPLHIYHVKKQRGAAESEIKKYLDLGLRYAEQQWELPTEQKYLEKMKNPEYYHNLGYSYQTRLWIDDMFMITALQSQAYLATGDE